MGEQVYAAVISKTFEKVRTESESNQKECGDCTPREFMPGLSQITHLDVRQNNLTDLADIWDGWSNGRKAQFTEKYGHIALLLRITIDEQLVCALIEFWDPSYRCFSFGQYDLTPTIEEIAFVLWLGHLESRPIYCKECNLVSLQNKLGQILDLPPQSTLHHIEHKGNTSVISWQFLKEYIREHSDREEALDAYALAIYGLVLFPRILEHIEVAIVDLFKRLKRNVHLAPTILAEIIRALNACQKLH